MSGCYDIRARGTVKHRGCLSDDRRPGPPSCPGTWRHETPPGRAVAPIWSDGHMVRTTRHAGQWDAQGSDRFARASSFPSTCRSGTHAVRVTLDYQRSACILQTRLSGICWIPRAGPEARGTASSSRPARRPPAYPPGEPEPGRWQMIIGLYRVPLDGLPYEVTAEIVSASRPPAGSAPAVPRAPAAAAAAELASQPRRSSGARATCTCTPFTSTARSPWMSSRGSPSRAGWTSSWSPTLDRQLRQVAARCGLPVRDHPDPRAGGHHERGTRRGTGRHRVGGLPEASLASGCGLPCSGGDLPPAIHPIACRAKSWMHAMPERPPLVEVWHWSWLDLQLDNAAVLAAGLGPGRHPGRWQRPAPDWIGCAARHAHHLGGVCLRWRGRDSRQHRRWRGGDLGALGRPGAAAYRGRTREPVDADGSTLAGPDGPTAWVRGDQGRFPAAAWSPPAAERDRGHARAHTARPWARGAQRARVPAEPPTIRTGGTPEPCGSRN